MGAEDAKREADYYRRQLETLTADQIRLEYMVSRLQHAARQKKQGFALLAALQQSIGVQRERSAIVAHAVRETFAALLMDRVMAFEPTGEADRLRPWYAAGFPEHVLSRADAPLDFPEGFAAGRAAIIVHKGSPGSPVIDALRVRLELPFFVCVPISGEAGPLGALLCGRLSEAAGITPALDDGDADTLFAIAGLVSASVRNLRIAALEEARRELENANARLKHEEATRTRLFVNLSHDFRTPLGLIQGEAELLRREVPAESLPALRRIESNSAYLANLVDELLELARLEAGRAPCHAIPFALDALVFELASQLQPSEPGCSLRVRAQPVVVRADPKHVRRILSNVVTNALRQLRGRGGEVRVEVGPGDEGFAQVEAIDDGPGIRPEHRPRLFERFASFDRDGSTVAGIGLPLSRELAQLNGGSLEVIDGAPKTTFRLRLPISDEPPQAFPETESRPAAEPAAEPVAYVPARPPVLAIEDHPEMRKLLVRALEERFDVRIADSLAAARAELGQLVPRALLSDVLLPDGTGLDFVREVRAKRELDGVPLLLVSALSSVEARVEGLRAGADDYLAKPFSPAELSARLAAAIGRADARREALRRQREEFVMELHDGVSASLARAAAYLGASPVEPVARRALAEVREGLDEARAIMKLHEGATASWESVVFAVERDLEEGCAGAGLGLDFSTASDGSCRRLSSIEQHALRRVAREALTNTIKHAGARRVGAELFAEAGQVRLRLADDGRGLPKEAGGGQGMATMTGRIRRLGGDLQVANGTGRGVVVEARFRTSSEPESGEPKAR